MLSHPTLDTLHNLRLSGMSQALSEQMHMADIGELRLSQSIPKDMMDVVTNSKVIPELF